MEKPKVVVAGHICLDITPKFPRAGQSSAQSANHGDFIAPGKLVRVEGADIHAGGVVANTGLALALFGADVTFMGKVGKDAFGSMVLDCLRASGGGKGLIVSEEASTSYSVVIAPPGCDRAFLHDPGANDGFTSSDLDMGAIAGARLFHFGYPPLMAAMFRNNGEELVRAFRSASEAGVMTSLDLAGVDPDSEAGGADWARILARTLPFTDFFFPSFEELCFMLDRSALERLRAKAKLRAVDLLEALSVEEDIAPLAERSIGLGAKVVIVKCGAAGFYWRTAEEPSLRNLSPEIASWHDRAGFEASYVPERVLSATGAGDTMIAAFLASMLRGYALDRCCMLAAAAGASCCESYDALSGLLPLDELERRIAAGWRKRIR
jgi:sugar/nucleoside kinase (ribokinase family)